MVVESARVVSLWPFKLDTDLEYHIVYRRVFSDCLLLAGCWATDLLMDLFILFILAKQRLEQQS